MWYCLVYIVVATVNRFEKDVFRDPSETKTCGICNNQFLKKFLFLVNKNTWECYVPIYLKCNKGSFFIVKV